MSDYRPASLDRDALAQQQGPVILDFGTGWCGHCQHARPIVDAVLVTRPEISHLRIEDGPGRRLGRAFGVKLWPTLVLLQDGVECARVVRPTATADIETLLAPLAPSP